MGCYRIHPGRQMSVIIGHKSVALLLRADTYACCRCSNCSRGVLHTQLHPQHYSLTTTTIQTFIRAPRGHFLLRTKPILDLLHPHHAMYNLASFLMICLAAIIACAAQLMKSLSGPRSRSRFRASKWRRAYSCKIGLQVSHTIARTDLRL